MKGKETFVGFTRSLTPGCCPEDMTGWVQNGPWYENLTPNTMETSKLEVGLSPEAKAEVKRLNQEVETLLEMARQKVLYATVQDNHAVHQRIGSALMKWRSEGLVRISMDEVSRLTAYQYQLLHEMDKQRADNAMQRICGGFQIQLEEFKK
jgi:predicted methyltransferase